MTGKFTIMEHSNKAGFIEVPIIVFEVLENYE